MLGLIVSSAAAISVRFALVSVVRLRVAVMLAAAAVCSGLALVFDRGAVSAPSVLGLGLGFDRGCGVATSVVGLGLGLGLSLSFDCGVVPAASVVIVGFTVVSSVVVRSIGCWTVSAVSISNNRCGGSGLTVRSTIVHVDRSGLGTWVMVVPTIGIDVHGLGSTWSVVVMHVDSPRVVDSRGGMRGLGLDVTSRGCMGRSGTSGNHQEA